MTAVTKAVSTAVSAKEKSEHYIPEPQFDTCGYNYPEYKTIEMPTLAEVDMNKSLDEAEYEKKLKKYQDKLFKLQNLCYQKKIPVIICYEGWDAAGKGGNIKRIAGALDRAVTKFIRSQARNLMRKQDITCGVSGRDCRKQDISLFLTAPGTEE